MVMAGAEGAWMSGVSGSSAAFFWFFYSQGAFGGTSGASSSAGGSSARAGRAIATADKRAQKSFWITAGS